MTTQAYSPILSELPYGRISGKVASASADADGWYYKPGAAVKISADHTFAKCASAADYVAGLVETGLNSHDTGGTLGANERLGVALMQGRRIDIVPAAEELAAGDLVILNYQGSAAKIETVIGATEAQADVSGTVAGGTVCTITIPAMDVTAAQNAHVHGIVWKGGASAAEVEIIVF